jgi:DNA-binding response OmpR family regulator
MSRLIAVVDDETDITSLVALHLTKSNFTVKEFHDAAGFFTYIKREIPDLLILDLMLPDADGLEICKRLKSDEKYRVIPIIMLTAKAEETDKIIGLELGADDYVTKPFSPKELVSRVKAVLRRVEQEEDTAILHIGDFIDIDSQQYTVMLLGKKIDLTITEFKILQLFASKPGRVFSRDNILEWLWGSEKYVIDRTIDVHIRHLRQKLGKYGHIIKNVRGVGYKLEV